MLKRSILIVITAAGILSAQGYQKEGTLLQFYPEFSGASFALGDTLILNNQKITIDNCKLYISKLEFYSHKKRVWAQENSFHLVDFTTPSSFKIQLATPASLHFDAIQFQLGIDSITNVSGAMGGDLDPTKGMYWTWQSGYINLKMEGYHPFCNARNHVYEFHLGGYMPPYQTIQTVELKVDVSKNIHIGIDLKNFLDNIDFQKQGAIMSPGREAQRLSALATKIFYTHGHD